MRYLLQLKGNEIIHVETGMLAGWVQPTKNGRLSVHREMRLDPSDRDKIGVVNSIDEALSLLTADYELHPPRWKRRRECCLDGRVGYTMVTTFKKWTFCGIFWVNKHDSGRWFVTRSGETLVRDGLMATFATSELARHVADLHEHDGMSKGPTVEDGYSWEDSVTWASPEENNGLLAIAA